MQKRPTRKAAAAKRGSAAPSTTRENPKATVAEEVEAVLLALKRLASKGKRGGTARSGPPPSNASGVPMAKMQTLAKRHGKNHELAAALWEIGGREARIVAAFVDDPACVTPEQMDLWCHDFDNWAVCDTACFHLFDRTPHALDKIAAWSSESGEFQKRASFALLASVSLHDEGLADAALARFLPTVEAAAVDERNTVKKAVGWALKAIGGRSLELNTAAVAVARRLSESPEGAARWVGMGTLRALTGPAATRRLAERTRSPGQ